MGTEDRFTSLVWPLGGEDPDDAFSSVPYEKVSTFTLKFEFLLIFFYFLFVHLSTFSRLHVFSVFLIFVFWLFFLQ